MIEHIHDFLEKHKHLWMFALAAVVLLVGTWKVLSYLESRDSKDLILKQAQLAQDQKVQKAASDQAANDAKAYQALKAQMDSQNAALRNQITQLSVALANRQAQDRTLAPPELAARWETLINLPGSVRPSPDGYIASLAAGTQTVVTLEEVPSLRQTVTNQEKLISNDKQELASIQTALASSQAEVQACKVTQKSADAACKAEVAEVKAKARKSKLKWFLGGLAAGAGLVARLLI